MEKALRLLLAGIVAGFILFLAASIVYNFTGEISDPSLRKLFRETVSMKWFHKLLLLNVGTGLIMAIFYSIVHRGLSGGAILKGIIWGFVVWAIMINQHLVFRIVAGQFSMDLLLTWGLQGLVSYVAAGIGIALIYKD